MPTETPLISVRMALDALSEQCELVDTLQARLEAERGVRDGLIQQAREARVPYSMLRKITHLSRDRLVTIVNAAPKDV